MRTVKAGERDIDLCTTCGALWFDFGEIRELTEGRVPRSGDKEGTAEGGAAEPARGTAPGPPGAGPRGLLRRMHREAASLSCPRCGGTLMAIDFQTTGVPVFLCGDCRGYLAPGGSATAIDARFRYVREHQAEYMALGEAMAEEFRRGMESRGETVAAGPGARPRAQVPLPILVPLGDDAPPLQSFPVMTYFLIALSAVLYFYFQVSGTLPRLPGGIRGIPSGSGVGVVPAAAIIASPFVHGGFVPLLAGALFLFVLGDNVEDRIGRIPFLILYLLCGAAAGVAHLLLGRTGHPAALGSAGAVAGVLGAYLVFFPQVSITMYGLGRLASVPAYMFACAWIVAAFLIGPGPFANFLNPAPFSFAGNVAGFAMGLCVAVAWRSFEAAVERPRA